jgi:hypothetical protein
MNAAPVGTCTKIPFVTEGGGVEEYASRFVIFSSPTRQREGVGNHRFDPLTSGSVSSGGAPRCRLLRPPAGPQDRSGR